MKMKVQVQVQVHRMQVQVQVQVLGQGCMAATRVLAIVIVDTAGWVRDRLAWIHHSHSHTNSQSSSHSISLSTSSGYSHRSSTEGSSGIRHTIMYLLLTTLLFPRG